MACDINLNATLQRIYSLLGRVINNTDLRLIFHGMVRGRCLGDLLSDLYLPRMPCDEWLDLFAWYKRLRLGREDVRDGMARGGRETARSGGMRVEMARIARRGKGKKGKQNLEAS